MAEDFSFIEGKLLSGIIYPEFFCLNQEDLVLSVGCGEGPQAITYKGRYKEMIGIDIQDGRLKVAERAMRAYGINNFKTVLGNVEKMPFESNMFDKILVVDLIEHVLNPKKVIQEMHRVIKDDGQLMITFPMMHDVYTNFASWVGKNILRRKKHKKRGWDPNIHHQHFNPHEWVKMMEDEGFVFVKSRGSTLFPPFHYIFGWPRFWFSNKYIHAVDNFFSRLLLIKYLGETLICVFRKNKAYE
ncbi:MAG: hypothetical protein COU81_03585 [Candidatus Portnoybacteria bacterium CG10_big_fil_rev_8_21_14_0_10_36_7]|uniref:Methyltransferase type 11 domain-containing protein n=1 Tax=Candidatus Portnoybacteria bacterium CG10_big_fil_rev_8_21_14_0_10_36_7 TaxID=1974812 RepID=A0A2M8KDB8_9BACT|nr:MAG: hypothetical protein COU81_03585 [Candidatus Portnoybacteria bacterium CG10_big_fil_rev_8_21_14_0_10_36_7]